jgi:integrase
MVLSDMIRHYNELLKADGCAARIYLDGNRLQLQATLPPAPLSSKSAPYQQRIALKLAATLENVEIADRKARILDRAIATGTFEWSDWVQRPYAIALKTCKEWIEIYQADFFNKRARTPSALTTWADHQKSLKKLPPNEFLTAKILKGTLLEIPADTRTRQKTARIFAILADLAGIQVNLTQYSGNYGLNSLEERSIPSDDLIEKWRDNISDPAWQSAYELLACYGLRPHELAYLNFENLPELAITGGKSRPRITYPCPNQWFDSWGVSSLLPRISGRNNSDIGNRVTHAFKRLSIPFNPYDLRHAWAIRSIQFYEPPIAAAMMGHSLATHNQRYHRWIEARIFRAAYETTGRIDP